MTKPMWQRSLSEVLKHQTQSVVLISEKTGNEYTTDVIPSLVVLSTGSIQMVDEKFKYSIVDTANDLEYVIKAPNKIDVKFGTVLQFKNVRGGSLSNGTGWYAADSVSEVKRSV